MHGTKNDLADNEAAAAAEARLGIAAADAAPSERLLICAAAPLQEPATHSSAMTMSGTTAGRRLDIALSLTLIALLLPVMALLAAAVAILDPGPVFFAHRRVGRGGRLFNCYKFRTMRVDAEAELARLLTMTPELREEWASGQKLVCDPRVTGLGRLLRSTSLDELPQLFNVLIGDMSLVGPRPITQDELQRYHRYAASYLSVRPGLTGLWQVSRCRHTTYQRRVATDVLYVRKKSIAYDCMILLLTVPAVIKGLGSY